MTYTLDCSSAFEVLQHKAELAERGYRYCNIGLTLYYWS